MFESPDKIGVAEPKKVQIKALRGPGFSLVLQLVHDTLVDILLALELPVLYLDIEVPALEVVAVMLRQLASEEINELAQEPTAAQGRMCWK
jgi:hypothetical protein